MEKNSKACFFENCPVVSLKVCEWEYPYEPFDTKKCDATPYGNEAFGVIEYASELIRDAFCNKKSIDSALGELVLLYTEQKSQKGLLHVFIGEWICDLALVFGVPNEIFRLCSRRAFEVAFVADFAAGDYICSFLKGEDSCDDKLFSALTVLSEYDYTKSPCLKSNREIYQKAMRAAVSVALKKALSEYGTGFFVPTGKRITRSAFSGLPCERECSKQLCAEYIPFSENTELCAFITALVKYTDNLVRQGLGIKSKLVGFTLSADYRRLISDTIRQAIPGFLPLPARAGRKPKKENEKSDTGKKEEIQQQPEPINLMIDFSRAKRLEAESWRLTSLIGSDYGTNDISINVNDMYGEGAKEEAVLKEKPVKDNTEAVALCENIPEEWRELFSLLTIEEKTVLCLVARGMDVQETIKKNGGMLKGVADSINEKAYDAYGDIIVEDVGRSLEFIPDYKDELTDIFYTLKDTEVI